MTRSPSFDKRLNLLASYDVPFIINIVNDYHKEVVLGTNCLHDCNILVFWFFILVAVEHMK